MPGILAAQCRFPPHSVPQTQVRDAVARLFQGRLEQLPRLLSMFDHARIVVVPGAQVRCRGPYRLMRHPNYLVAVLEFALIPLLMRAPLCLVFFFVNLLLLRRRIRLEEQTLRQFTDYSERFPASTGKEKVPAP